MIDSILHIDFETRSAFPLPSGGAYGYACDPSTDIICMAYAFGDDEVEVWQRGQEFPESVRDHVSRGAPRSIHAHNANFERLIIENVLARMIDLRPPPIEAYYDTAFQARSRALPAGLDDLGRCLRLKTQKDPRGSELIKLLSLPTFSKTTGEQYFREDPDLIAEMVEYCRRDVEVERAAAKATPPLTDEEQAVWCANERVNDRGLMIDRPLASAAMQYADAETQEINQKISVLTNGAVETAKQFVRLKDYFAPLAERDPDVAEAMTRKERNRKTGEYKTRIALDRNARMRLMGLEDLNPGKLDPKTVELLGLLDDAGRSSVSKYTNMINRASDDDRVRGAYIAAGASQTGRFSSWGLQVHNFPRDTSADPENARRQILDRRLDNVMKGLSQMLRPSIIAPEGYQFVCGDWAQIEARMLPWLSGEGDRVLDVFRAMDANPDVPDNYMLAASDIFNKPAADITKDERAVGKVVVLACGYAGGVGAFNSMARAYNVILSDEEAQRVVSAWRLSNPWAVSFWKALQAAAIEAINYPGTPTTAGRLTFYMAPARDTLLMQLPSSRIISYPQVRLQEVETPYGGELEITSIKANWKPAEGDREWPRVRVYGGLLAENATQAAAADILRGVLVELDELDWPVVGHTHDEVLLEVFDDEVDEATEMLTRAMKNVPDWAKGLPLNCEIWSGRRYRK